MVDDSCNVPADRRCAPHAGPAELKDGGAVDVCILLQANKQAAKHSGSALASVIALRRVCVCVVVTPH